MISNVSYPTSTRNYCLFDEKRINEKKDFAVIRRILENPNSEEEVLECLSALNLMLDEGGNKSVEDAKLLYPYLARYNNTKSPNIQTFLAGVYRKIKVPDAFGPLCVMLIQNAINPHKDCCFDPNEEIGGAILDYLA